MNAEVIGGCWWMIFPLCGMDVAVWSLAQERAEQNQRLCKIRDDVECDS